MWRLSMVSKRPDIFLSHDWPTGIWDYGDRDQLLKTKPFFRDDIKTNSLGSPPLMDLLKLIQPRFWFSAHLHVKFPAVVVHSTAEDPSEAHTTCFLALDKVLPGRDFLQVIPVECQREDMEKALHFDLEWLAILKRTHRNLSTSPGRVDLPSHMEPAISESVRSQRSSFLQLL
jgi:lariat debranching enzyme